MKCVVFVCLKPLLERNKETKSGFVNFSRNEMSRVISWVKTVSSELNDFSRIFQEYLIPRN